MDFVAHLDELPKMIAFIRSYLEKKELNAQQIYRVELASEEALVNVISYANLKEEHLKLSITCNGSAMNRFEVTISDPGIAFDPVEFVHDPKIDRPPEERAIGGLGIFLMKQLTEEIHYQRKDDRNILTLTFKLS